MTCLRPAPKLSMTGKGKELLTSYVVEHGSRNYGDCVTQQPPDLRCYTVFLFKMSPKLKTGVVLSEQVLGLQ